MSPARAHIAHSLTDNYFVVSSTVGNVGLCNPAHLIGLWLECMACILGDCSTTKTLEHYSTVLGCLVTYNKYMYITIMCERDLLTTRHAHLLFHFLVTMVFL